MKLICAKKGRRHWNGWLLACLIVVSSVGWLARGAAPASQAGAGGEKIGVAGEMRFVPVDVYVDTGQQALGAYQIELTARGASIVGLEGGEAAAYREAPFYDPAALQGKRIVVAAFSVADGLPVGMTRVARLHMAAGVAGGGNGIPEMTSKLVVATDGQGKTIEAKIELRPMQGARQ